MMLKKGKQALSGKRTKQECDDGGRKQRREYGREEREIRYQVRGL